jgi:hypothetical protein
MGKRVRQLLSAAVAPVLTVVCTWLVADWLEVGADLQKALGATAAGVLLFIAIELIDDLPKRSARWRRWTDPRAAFEGWWLQIHDGVDRVAVFSFLYSPEGDTYRAVGQSFDSRGELLAGWHSTRVFFSTGALSASYLWEGKTFEVRPPVSRKGTTSWSVQRPGSRSVLPVSGRGEVLHLNQDRILDFRVQRLSEQRVQELLGRRVALDALVDYDLQRELAVAYLKSSMTGTGAGHPS